MSYPKTSVIVPSLNEGDWLLRTVRSIRWHTPKDWQIVHVDDASEQPEPDLSKYRVKEVSLPKRRGTAIARAVGFLESDPDSLALGTVDSHMLFGPGDALAGLVEELQRFQTIEEKMIDELRARYEKDGDTQSLSLIKDKSACVRNASVWEAGVHIEPDKLGRLAQIAVDNDCFAYMTPCRMGPASIYWQGGLLRVKYMGKRGGLPEANPSAAVNGGCYFGSRHAWERIGGYPQLSGHFGFEEEILALLAAAFKIPILCATEMSPWHVFRGQGMDVIPKPYDTAEDKQVENLAGVYRIAFSERYWQERWRVTLAEQTLPGRNGPVPEWVLCDVEQNDALTQYRDELQADFVLHDEELIAELDARRLADEKLLLN